MLQNSRNGAAHVVVFATPVGEHLSEQYELLAPPPSPPPPPAPPMKHAVVPRALGAQSTSMVHGPCAS